MSGAGSEFLELAGRERRCVILCKELVGLIRCPCYGSRLSIRVIDASRVLSLLGCGRGKPGGKPVFQSFQFPCDRRVPSPSRNVKKEIRDAGQEMRRKLENHNIIPLFIR